MLLNTVNNSKNDDDEFSVSEFPTRQYRIFVTSLNSRIDEVDLASLQSQLPQQSLLVVVWSACVDIGCCFRVVVYRLILHFHSSQRMDFKKFTSGAGTLFNRAKQVDPR